MPSAPALPGRARARSTACRSPNSCRSTPVARSRSPALLSGQIDVGLLFTTDARSTANDSCCSGTTAHLQPAENVTPIVTPEVLERSVPAFADVVNAVSAALTTTDLRAMNAAVEAGRSPTAVARTWLGSGPRSRE